MLTRELSNVIEEVCLTQTWGGQGNFMKELMSKLKPKDELKLARKRGMGWEANACSL